MRTTKFMFLLSFLCWKYKQEKLKEFLEKRERGELLVQKKARLFEKFLAHAQLSAPTTYVSFDQAIQVIACDMPNIHSTMDRPLALSVVVNEPHINRCQEIDQHCEISCAPSARPSVRNSFIIRKPSLRHHRRQCNSNGAANRSEIANDESADGQYLKYGQDFMLECYESKQKPLMLYSSPKSPFTAGHSDYVATFKVHGEIKQSVGLAMHRGADLNSGSSNGRPIIDDADTIPSKFFHWRLYHVNPDIRYETIGENIRVRIW